MNPLGDKVVIQVEKLVTATETGILLPENDKKKPNRGKVTAVGPGKKDEPMTVKVGDTVIYAKHAGSEVIINDEKFLIMRESEIIGIIE